MKKQVLGSLMILVVACSTRAGAELPDEARVADRERMVREQIEDRGVKDKRVLEVMRTVPRHKFVGAKERDRAYNDHPLPIGHGQTISQPYIVAAMTELLEPKPTDRILEIGAGSGYQAAVLSRLVREVYSIEIVPELAKLAKQNLEAVGYKNVTVIAGDGYRGLPDKAPFDGVIVTAAPGHIPQPLIDQLKIGGKMVIPVGDGEQELHVLVKTKDGVEKKKVFDVRFVPMTGEAQSGKKN